MDELQMPDLGGVNWAELLTTAQTTGLEFGLKVVIAIVIFYVGRVIAKVLTGSLRRVMQARNIEKILETFLCNLVYWLVMTFAIIAAINQVGIETTSLIAVMGAAGLAVGLALQGSLANFAAGVLIVLFRPYRVGDWIEAAGVAGTVLHVQILTTALKTGDNKRIIVPNGQIMDSVITNFSAHDTRRVDLTIGVSYDDDLDKTRKTLQALIDADERVLKDPAPLIAVAELGASSVNFTVRPWVKTEDFWPVKFELTEAIKKRFDEEDISFPFPQQDVHLYKES